MEVARDLALILSSVGAGVFVPKLLASLWRAITGSGERQRAEIDRERTARRSAERMVDVERRGRRIAQEHASHLRRLLFAAPCVDPATIPPFPDTMTGGHDEEVP